jgi:hypothetical protein
MLTTSLFSGLDKAVMASAKGYSPRYEGFETASESLSRFLFWLYVVFLLASGFGAAYLSWNLNMYLGTSTGISVLYAILAFIFSEAYYPFYAFFLNPVSGKKGNNNGSANNMMRRNNNRF